MDNLSYTNAYFVSTLSALTDPEDTEKITKLLLGIYVCHLLDYFGKNNEENLRKKIEDFQEKNILFSRVDGLKNLDLLEVEKIISFPNLDIKRITIKNGGSVFTKNGSLSKKSILPQRVMLGPVSAQVGIVQHLKEIPQRVREDSGVWSDTELQKGSNLLPKRALSLFRKKIRDSFEQHKRKHSKYEVRFFWPSSIVPEVCDPHGLIFNEKYYTHKLTKDKYIVTNNKYNIKIRGNELQVKAHIENINSISHFKNKKIINFPIKGKKIEKILQQKMISNSDVLETPGDLLRKLPEFLGSSCIEILKERYVRKMADHTKIEVSLIKIRGKQWKTICIESKRLEKVLALSLLVNQKNAEKLTYDEFLHKYGSSKL